MTVGGLQISDQRFWFCSPIWQIISHWSSNLCKNEGNIRAETKKSRTQQTGILSQWNSKIKEDR